MLMIYYSKHSMSKHNVQSIISIFKNVVIGQYII